MQATGEWHLRRAVESLAKSNRASALLHRQKGPDGPAARFHQEDSENSEQGLRTCGNEQSQASKGIEMKARKKRRKTDHSGSTFDSLLEQEGIREEVEAVAIKRVLAWQFEKAMQEQQ